MCGIVGIVGTSPNHSELGTMIKKLAHRGPDGSGMWQEDANFSLGHLRLSIIDLSQQATQPMVCPNSGNVIIFNGEIYNYKELRQNLSQNYTFRTQSDTEVLLAAYLKWGIYFVNYLRGMFALAIYDKSKRHLLLARDRFGIKPLYFSKGNGSFWFASEEKALTQVVNSIPKVNEIKVLEYICSRQQDCDDQTMFKDIFQLLPGHFMVVDSQGQIHQKEKYWDFPIEFGCRKMDNDSLEELKYNIRESVKTHLVADVSVGSFLSGGLDSSTISCLAAEEYGDSLVLFSSLLKDQSQHEENALIPIVQKHLRSRHKTIVIDDMPFLDEVENLIYHHDEPIGDGSMYAHYALCRLAQQHQIKVLLSGSGGDEVFGGYPAHTYSYLGSLLKKGDIFKLIQTIGIYRHNRTETAVELVKRSIQETMPYTLRKQLKYQQFKAATQHISFGSLYDKQRYYYYENADPWMANYLNCFKSWTIPPFLHYEDRNAMAFGVEARVPFLDHVLIEYIFNFSPENFVGSRSKNLIRNSMRGVVPDPILDQREKHGFPAPLNYFLKKDQKKTLELYYEKVKKVPFLDQKLSMNLSNNFFNGTGSSGLHEFWRTFSLAIWYDIFFNQNGK